MCLKIALIYQCILMNTTYDEFLSWKYNYEFARLSVRIISGLLISRIVRKLRSS